MEFFKKLDTPVLNCGIRVFTEFRSKIIAKDPLVK